MGGRALVLGGGGVTGVAWELGILAGLADKGIDLSRADLIIGTSAGSVVGAQISTGRPVTQLYDAQLEPPVSEVAARMGPLVIARLSWAMVRARSNPQAGLARVGAMAKRAHTMPQAARKAVIASRLPVKEWPERQRLIITAVSADEGEFVSFDKDSGVSLVDAVAASCAVPGVWPPSDVNGRLFIDGGIRSPANVDLVGDGYDRVVVIAPLVQAFRREATPRAQLASLPGVNRSTLISPSEAAKSAIGNNVLNPARRAGSARAGRQQAADVAAQVEQVWQS